MRSLIVVLGVMVVASACSLVPAATPTATAWGDRVPEANRAVVAAQPVVTEGPNSITLLPVSPTGAAVGVTYAYDMPHCGISSPIDVDGTFWDAVGVPVDSTDFDGQTGTFKLVSATEATFTATNGKILRLERHDGAKEFRICS